MINHDWKIEDLPKLPEPWYWERGDIDGDPSAVRRQGGWICCVHEGNACRYSDEITITTRHDPEFEGELAFASAGSGCIPFPVFEAVHKALKIFYAKDDENMEKSIQHERERGDKWKRAYELANKQCEELEALMAPGVIEGMRRACLLRKDASPEEVLNHLKDVASSYEGIFSRLKEAKKLCAEAIDICVEQDGAAGQLLYDLLEVLEGVS
jgi:hypothetical protein